MTTKCEACSTGTMAGPIPGVLSNGERCDSCELFESDERANLVARLTAQLRTVYETLRNYTDGEETQAVGKILNETELLLSEVE
jgi:hypothetical protein